MPNIFNYDTPGISDATLYGWMRAVSIRRMRAPEQRCATCNCFLRVTRGPLARLCDPCRETREEKRLLEKPKPQQRGRPGHMRDGQGITEKTIAKFWRYCRNGTHRECWGWTGNVTPKGAPIFSHDCRVISARRVSWQIHKGEMTDNRKLFTRCRADCVNPAHLFFAGDKPQRKRKTKAQDADNIKTLSRTLRGLGYMVVTIATD